MKMNEKQKIIVSVAVFLVVLGGLLALNYLKYKDRKELVAKMSSLEKEERSANAKIKQIPELREKRSNLASVIEQYVKILPPEQHIHHEAFAEIIDGYSKETQVVIQKVESVVMEESDDEKDKKKKEDENFIRHRYKVQLVGSFPNFRNFVNKIENHKRFLKVDEIMIRPLGADRNLSSSNKNDAAILDMAKVPFKNIELVVSTYTYKKD